MEVAGRCRRNPAAVVAEIARHARGSIEVAIGGQDFLPRRTIALAPKERATLRVSSLPLWAK